MSFKFHSNIPKAKAQLKDNEFRALKAVGQFVEGAAQLNAPVDLGNLSASIANEVDSSGSVKAVHVGTNVEYAPYQEFGTGVHAKNGDGRKTPWAYEDPKTGELIWTRGNKPQPFLMPAFEKNKGAIKQIMKKNLGDGL